MLSVWQSPSLAKSKAKFISRMRGPQSDPTHTYAPVCPCALRYTRITRGHAHLAHYCLLLAGGLGGLGAGVARIQHFAGERFNGSVARFWGWPIRWPTLALFLALLGRFWALLGLCWRRAMLAAAWARLQCLFSLYETTVLEGYTVCQGTA